MAVTTTRSYSQPGPRAIASGSMRSAASIRHSCRTSSPRAPRRRGLGRSATVVLHGFIAFTPQQQRLIGALRAPAWHRRDSGRSAGESVAAPRPHVRRPRDELTQRTRFRACSTPGRPEHAHRDRRGGSPRAAQRSDRAGRRNPLSRTAAFARPGRGPCLTACRSASRSRRCRSLRARSISSRFQSATSRRPRPRVPFARHSCPTPRRSGHAEAGRTTVAGGGPAPRHVGGCPFRAAAVRPDRCISVSARSRRQRARRDCHATGLAPGPTWLAALGWPGDAPLTSAQWQARDAWSNALAKFASSGMITGAMTGAVALQTLRALLAETLWAPEAAPAPVQILGVLEAAGLSFDYAWLAGFDAHRWPACRIARTRSCRSPGSMRAA